MSSYQNMTNLTDFMTISNDIVGGDLLFFMLEATIWIVLFLGTFGFGKWRALSYSSLVVGIIMFGMNLAGLIPYWHLVFALCGYAIGTFMMLTNKNTVGR